MDEEDRTPMPEGFDEKIWRKADEVFHATALVANDADCVKIIYAALAAPASVEPVEALRKEIDRLRGALLSIAVTCTEDSHGNTKDYPVSWHKAEARKALTIDIR